MVQNEMSLQASSSTNAQQRRWNYGLINRLLVFLVFCNSALNYVASTEPKPTKFFTNGWAVKIAGTNHNERVKRIAEKYGFDKISKVRIRLHRLSSKFLDF